MKEEKVEAILDGTIRKHWNLNHDQKDRKCQNQGEKHLGEKKTSKMKGKAPGAWKKVCNPLRN